MDYNAENNRLSEAVLDAGRLEDVLVELGCDVRGYPGGTSFRGRCPVHNGDHLNFHVGAYGRDLLIHWKCHSHKCERNQGLKPTLLGLVRGVLSKDKPKLVTFREAIKFVEGVVGRCGPARPPTAAPERVEWNFSKTRAAVRAPLTIPSPYFLGRGFAPAVLDDFDIGESRKLGRVVAPIYDDSGSACVGWTQRFTFEPEYGRPWRFPEYFPKGDYLYNVARARGMTAPVVLLVEGVPDVLRATEAGIPAVAGLGNSLTDTQLDKLAALGRKVVIGFDNDEAGQKGAKKVSWELQQMRVEVEVRHPPATYKDYGEMRAAEVASWLADQIPPGEGSPALASSA